MAILSPLTNNKDISLISNISCSQLISDWKKNFEIDISHEFLDSDKVHLYQCNQTKLFFFEPISCAGSSWLYEQLQKFDWFYMPYKWEHQIALQDLKNCHNVLEVGCAYGSFIEKGIEAGLKIQGIELNKAAARTAQSRSLPVKNIDLQEYALLNPESLDAVCSFQVLEHIPNPKSFIKSSIQALKHGGKLIFCVPNAESFLKYQYNLLDMPPHHMTRWSEAVFIALERLFPIKLERVVKEPLASYHTAGYLNSYSTYFRSQVPLSRIIINRHTLNIYEQLLQLGLRKFLTGQSLYVQFKKV